ncbi:MAG: autorepressor SdpR family transcription factor [Lachnospiraceae bacterium]|nr:autorepressor SdpR family transcription factor [Lachnospiraceae bacterium]
MAFADTFKALSDPVRRQILELLKDGSLSAGEIGSHFDMTGATISYHLSVLKKADLVRERRDKNYIYYELNTSVLEEVMLWLSDLKGGAEHD